MDENAHISDSRRTPSAPFCEALDAKAGDLCVGATLLPRVDTAGAEGGTLVCVESTGDDGKDVQGDGMKDDVGIAGRADADVAARRALHCGGVRGGMLADGEERRRRGGRRGRREEKERA